MKEGRRRGLLSEGFRSLSHVRLILLLTATTIALALPAALSLWPALRETFGGTLAGDHVLRNHPAFAPTDVLEFLSEKRDAIAGACTTALAMSLLGVILQAFYAGGFVATLGRGERVSIGELLTSACRNFGHNLKCLAICLVGTALALGIWLSATGALRRKLFGETPPGALSRLLFRVVVGLAALLLFALFSLLHDFARLARRSQPAVGAWRAWSNARRLLSRFPLSGLSLFFFWAIVGGTAWLLLLGLEWSTLAVSAAAVLGHTLLQVAATAARSAVRLGAWGSLVALYDRAVESSGPTITRHEELLPTALAPGPPPPALNAPPIA